MEVYPNQDIFLEERGVGNLIALLMTLGAVVVMSKPLKPNEIKEAVRQFIASKGVII
jgi:hypothetical protein